jgi:energy-coupling factor transport system substrate-specific component
VFFIVMITGYVFGSVSGFIVGATTMFISNFFVGGHGPWTPFQMTALGLTGVGAAFLPRMKCARLRMLILCIYAVFSAFFYSAVTDVFWWMTFTREQTIKTYLAVSAAGVLFSVARAVGTILFTIFFGPALIKIFTRFKNRFLVEYVD